MDFGCGNGRLGELIESMSEQEQAGLDYQGVDIAEDLIEVAEQKYPTAKFRLIEAEGRLPFAANSFDLIVSIAVFHHLTPAMAKKALIELKRVLKPEGILIITGWFLWKGKYLKHYRKQQVEQKTAEKTVFLPFSNQKGNEKEGRFCYLWQLEEFTDLVEKAGFGVEKNGFTYAKSREKRNFFVIAKKDG